MWKIIIKEESSVATPVGTGKHSIYVDSSDKKLKKKNESWAVDSMLTESWINSLIYFWDWSDGDVTITTTVTLARDMYYNNLTITSPWILNPNGYKIYIKWILSGNGKIQRNGNNWWNWGWYNSWVAWAAWAILNQWTLNAELQAGNGWYDGSNLPAQSWLNANPSYTTINAWFGWTATRWLYYNKVLKFWEMLFPASIESPLRYKWCPSSSWGDGAYRCWGGWAGWNGGTIWIACNIVNWTWTFEAIGGNWWNGWPSANTWYSWWKWGNGWQWGILVLIYKTLTSIWTKTLTKWTKWFWAGNWAADWVDWNNWESIEIAI